MMNGYGRRGYMPMPQGGAGYNLYSKYPDIVGLAEKFMQNMMMMKQMKQQREQQMWQRGMEEKKQKSLEAYRQTQAQPEPSQWQQRVTYAAGLVKEGKMEPDEFHKYILTNQWPSGLTPYQETQIARGKKKDFQSMLQNSIRNFDSEIKRMEMPLSTTQLITAATTGTWPEMDINEDAIANMKIGRGEIMKLLTLSHERNLTSKEKALAGTILSQRDRLAKEGAFWKPKKEKTKTPVKIVGTVKRANVPRNAEVRTLPSGRSVVKIGGKFYGIIEE